MIKDITTEVGNTDIEIRLKAYSQTTGNLTLNYTDLSDSDITGSLSFTLGSDGVYRTTTSISQIGRYYYELVNSSSDILVSGTLIVLSSPLNSSDLIDNNSRLKNSYGIVDILEIE